jgi:hypothetical protein
MSDITVCSGGGCPFQNICWRALAPRDPLYQSSFVSPPFEKSWRTGEIGSCDYLWKYDPREETKEDE